MYLKKLEIQGFKSFAHKTVLEFEPGIISVVGPNGSGKSNFSDAIRWVLGEQSMKMIRSKKSEDVIFAGSDKKSKLGMAEVAITFDNEDRKLPLDFSEVIFARRLFRDGESEYLLNNRAVRLMDIVELLAKSGYGNNSYHVISQGTIDQMVIAGPSAIKNIIEEASGVKPYYMKRERSERKLERSEQNLQRVADLVAEIEPRLRSLRRQAKKMAQRDELVAELKGLQLRLYSVQYHGLLRGLTEHESKVKYFDQQIQTLGRELEELDGAVKALEQQTSQHSGQYAKLQEEIRNEEKGKNKIQEDLAIIRGQLKAGAPFGASDKSGLQLRRHDLQNKIKMIDSHLEDLKHQAVLHRKNLADYKKIYEKQEDDLERIRKSIDMAKTPFDLSRLKDDIERVYTRYQSLIYQLKNIKSEEDLNLLQQDAENLEIVLVKLKDRVVQVSSLQMDNRELVQLNSQLQQIFGQKEKLQSEIAFIQAALNSFVDQEKFYRQQLAEYQTELERIGQELDNDVGQTADDHWKDLTRQETKLNEELQKYFSRIQKMEEDLKRFLDTEALQKKELLELERQHRNKQDVIIKTKDQRGLVLIEKARSDASMESLLSEIRKTLGNEFVEMVKQQAPSAIEAGLEQKVQKLKAQLEMIGGVDELTMQEYRETEERYNHLTSESKDLHSAIADLRQVISELETVIKKQFQNGFEQINENFEEYFRILFSGGRAHMSLVREKPMAAVLVDNGEEADEEPEVSETEEEETAVVTGREEVTGIEIRATPPGKKLNSLSALSGGERTLTSIALLMAILTAFPSPFVVLDEVDAALDEANSIRFGKILSKLAHQTQFITITHNRETMRQAGVLYGITMGDDGISKVLSIKLEHAVEIAQ